MRLKPFISRKDGGGGNRTRVVYLRELPYVQDLRRRIVADAATIFAGSPTTLYAIEEHAGPIKIGHGVEPAKRLEQLQAGNPRPLYLRFACPATPGVEAFVHRELAAFRIRGEWFERTDRVLSVVDEFESLAEMASLCDEDGCPDVDAEFVRDMLIERVADEVALRALILADAG